MAEDAKWYVIHTYSGYENAVAAAIMKAAENRRMQDLIQEVNIPMETVKEITDSGEKTVERKVFPGYVLVKMVLTDESWHLVHNVRGAAGFVGSDGKASPLTEQEIYDLGVDHHEVVVGYELGDSVKITDGPLSPLHSTANICLMAKSDMSSFVDSFAAPLSLNNALIVALGQRRRHEVSEYFESMEQIWDKYDVYLARTGE